MARNGAPHATRSEALTAGQTNESAKPDPLPPEQPHAGRSNGPPRSPGPHSRHKPASWLTPNCRIVRCSFAALGECDKPHHTRTKYRAGTTRSMNHRCHAYGTKVTGGNQDSIVLPSPEDGRLESENHTWALVSGLPCASFLALVAAMRHSGLLPWSSERTLKPACSSGEPCALLPILFASPHRPWDTTA